MLYTKELAEQIKKAIAETEIKVEDDEECKFDVIATTEDTDRDNEVIKVNGWDTSNWEKNPVILANHDYTVQSIIWKGLKFYTSNGQKRLKWVFSKTNPLWVLAKNLYQEWMLKTVSVWFIPLKRNEQDYKIIEKAELLEVSFVAVPANPNAVSLDWKLFAEWVEKGLIKEIQEPVGEHIDDDENAEDLQIKTTEMEEVKKELAEIKEILKSISTKDIADDKVDDQEIDELKEKKELIQSINKWTAKILESMKKL